MNFDQLVDLIVEEVLKRLQNKPKRALVLFTGGCIGFNKSILQIKKLIKNDWNINVVLSNSAKRVLTPKLIKDKLEIDDVYLEDDIDDLYEVLNGVDLLILPTLTMNTAAKIALCISDTLATNIVSNAIMKGIEIIAVKDACDIENSTRLSLGYNKAPSQYINRMKDYMKILEDYRIKLVDSLGLFELITGNKKNERNPSNQLSNNLEVFLDNKVITRGDIVNASQRSQRITIGKTAVITALANDAIRDMGLEIIRKA